MTCPPKTSPSKMLDLGLIVLAPICIPTIVRVLQVFNL